MLSGLSSTGGTVGVMAVGALVGEMAGEMVGALVAAASAAAAQTTIIFASKYIIYYSDACLCYTRGEK